MRKKIIIAKLIMWGLRFVFYISLVWVLTDYFDLIYSLICALLFMMFWIWCFWLDYKINPVIRYDENGV